MNLNFFDWKTEELLCDTCDDLVKSRQLSMQKQGTWSWSMMSQIIMSTEISRAIRVISSLVRGLQIAHCKIGDFPNKRIRSVCYYGSACQCPNKSVRFKSWRKVIQIYQRISLLPHLTIIFPHRPPMTLQVRWNFLLAAWAPMQNLERKVCLSKPLHEKWDVLHWKVNKKNLFEELEYAGKS